MTAPITGRLLDYEYAVEVDDPALAQYVRSALVDSVAPVDSPESVVLRRDDQGRFVLTVGGDTVLATRSGTYALASLFWRLNRRTVDNSGGSPLIHAGAVDVGDGVVLLVAPSGGGKSTATAALCRRGGTYLTDDVLQIRPDGSVVGANKPFSFREPSWKLLGVDPVAMPGPPSAYGPAPAVAATTLGARAATASAAYRVRTVVFIERPRPGARSGPLTRGEGLKSLVEGTFTLGRDVQSGLDILRQLSADVEFISWPRSELSSLPVKALTQSVVDNRFEGT